MMRWKGFISKRQKRQRIRQTLLLLAVGVFVTRNCIAADTANSTKKNQPKTVLIELDGSSSSDPEGRTLAYSWRQISGPRVSLSNKNTVKPFFRTSSPGRYRFELVVSDGNLHSAPTTVEVVVKKQNRRPEARVGRKEVRAVVGRSVQLNGGGSRDADGDSLTYHWRQLGGPPLYLRPQAVTGHVLTLSPQHPGVYELELIVNDGHEQSVPARCKLLVSPPNRPPVARAKARHQVILERPPELTNADIEANRPVAIFAEVDFVEKGTEVTLDGSQSYSPNKKNLRYYWTQKSGPFVRSFKRKQDYSLDFTPSKVGNYVFSLIVSDGKKDSAPVLRTVRVRENNAAPVAVAVAKKKVVVGERVALDGSESFDREGAKLTYSWRQTAGRRIRDFELTDPRGSSVPIFKATTPGRYTFALVVSDGKKKSKPAYVTVEVLGGNLPPVAKTGGNLTIYPGETAVIQGRGRDPEGQPVSYAWTQIAGPVEILHGTATQQSLTLSPRSLGEYKFVLVVSDGVKKSVPVTTSLLVKQQVFESFPAPEISFRDLPMKKFTEARGRVGDGSQPAAMAMAASRPLPTSISRLRARSRSRRNADRGLEGAPRRARILRQLPPFKLPIFKRKRLIPQKPFKEPELDISTSVPPAPANWP